MVAPESPEVNYSFVMTPKPLTLELLCVLFNDFFRVAAAAAAAAAAAQNDFLLLRSELTPNQLVQLAKEKSCRFV
jgi:hypothetical protein